MNLSQILRRIITSLLCATLVFVPFASYLLQWNVAPLEQTMEKITITPTHMDNTEYSPVFSFMLRQGGVKVDSHRVLEMALESEGWSISNEDTLTCKTLNQPISFMLPFPNSYEFILDSHCFAPWITIQCEHGTFTQNLYHGNVFETQLVPISGNVLHPEMGRSVSTGVLAAIWLALSAVFVLLCGFGRQPVLPVFAGCTVVCLAAAAVWLGQLCARYFALMALSLVCIALLCMSTPLRNTLRRFTKGWYLAGMICLCAYTAFALYGNRLFTELPVIRLSIRVLSMFWMLAVITVPVVCTAVAVLFLWQSRAARTSSPSPRDVRITRLCCFGVMLVPLALMLIGFYPCTTPPDGTVYWNRAVSQTPLSYPFLYNLLLRGLSYLSDNPVLYTALQMLFFAAVVSGLCTLFYRHGLSRPGAVALSLVSALLPGNSLNVVMLSTNPLMAILLLYLLYLLALLADDAHKCLHSPAWMIGAVVGAVMVGGVRRNGLPSLWIFVLILAFYAWKYRTLWRRLAALAACILILSSGLNVLGDRMMTETDLEAENASTIARFLFKPVASAYVNGCDLPEETMDVINKVYRLSWLELRYAAHISDHMVHSEHNQLHLESNATYIRLFLDTLCRYPAVVLKDLLDQSETVWCVFQCPIAGNIRFRTDVSDMTPPGPWLTESPFPALSRKISGAVLSAAQWIGKQPLLDSLSYRAGLYVILFLMQTLVLLQRRRLSRMIPMLPVLALAFTTFPGASWPIFEYFWFFPLTAVFHVLICRFLND